MVEERIIRHFGHPDWFAINIVTEYNPEKSQNEHTLIITKSVGSPIRKTFTSNDSLEQFLEKQVGSGLLKKGFTKQITINKESPEIILDIKKIW